MQVVYRIVYAFLAVLYVLALVVFLFVGFLRWIVTGRSPVSFAAYLLNKVTKKDAL